MVHPLRRPEPLITLSARRGFPGLNVPNVQKLLTMTGQQWEKGQRPKQELEVLKALLSYHLPSLSDEEVQRIIDATGSKSSDPDALPSQLLQGDNMKIARDVLDEDDADDVEKDIAKIKEVVQAARQAKAKLAPKAKAAHALARHRAAEGAVSASATAASRSRQPLPVLAPGRLCYSPEEVSRLKPLVPKCVVARELRWHHRWRSQYRGKRTSRVFVEADAESELAAILHCLKFVWAEHEVATGTACPWAFPRNLRITRGAPIKNMKSTWTVIVAALRFHL